MLCMMPQGKHVCIPQDCHSSYTIILLYLIVMVVHNNSYIIYPCDSICIMMLNIYDSIIIPITSYSTYTVLLASPDDRPESRNPDRGGSKKCGLWQNCSKRPSWSQNASQETHALNKLLGSTDLTRTKVDNPSMFFPNFCTFYDRAVIWESTSHHCGVLWCMCILLIYQNTPNKVLVGGLNPSEKY